MIFACNRTPQPTLGDARVALDAGNYVDAKALAMDSGDTQRFDFINKIDELQKKAGEQMAEVKFSLAHAIEDGREKTQSRLQWLKSSGIDRKVRDEAAKGLAALDGIFANAPKPAPVNPNVPRPGVIETERKPPVRYIDTKPPEDSFKKKQSMAPSARVKEAMEFAATDLARGRYQLAIEILAMTAAEVSPEERSFLRDRIDEIQTTASRELAVLISDSSAPVGNRIEALEKLYGRLGDFPPSSELEDLRGRLESVLLGSADSATLVLNGPPAERGKRTPGTRFTGSPLPVEPEVEALYGQARTAFESGDYKSAEQLFLRASDSARSEVLKDDARARAIESTRIAGFIVKLQNALQVSAISDFNPGTGRRGKLSTVTGRGVVVVSDAGTETIDWNAISQAAWRSILDRAGALAIDQKLGASILLARAGMDRDADRMLKDAVDADAKLADEINLILARRRNIAVPSYGFVWFNDRYVTFKERETFKLAATIKATLQRIEEATSPRERENFSNELLKLGAEGADALAIALKERRAEIVKKLRDTGFARKIEPLRALHRELAAARQHALDLIFDEQKYFYPYRPPECPPEKARLYPAVEQEVSKRVAAVQELWDSKLSVSINGGGAALRMLHEIERRRIELKIFDIEDDDEETQLFLSIDATAQELTIRNFCASPMEKRSVLDYNRKVKLFNAMAKTDMSVQEQQCASLTNQYREMFGRRILAYNNKLVHSSQKHCKWMADVGQLSHFESDPKSRTPYDRMGLEGYTKGISENCAFALGAAGAFEGWRHSSGHHRNMLMPGHTEFGVGGNGQYWTQNFGIGDEYKQHAAWPRN